MSIEARWIASVMASGLHLAECSLAGVSLEAGLQAGLSDEIAALSADLVVLGLQREAFFAQAIPLAVRFDEPRAWSTMCLKRLRGLDPEADAVGRLERRLRSLIAAMMQSKPKLLEELEHRGMPLGELWEARGPGLLATVARLTEPQLVVEAADVILVLPARGGGGQAFAPYNALAFEALLANSHERLPEVLRLGWLWSQLSLDLPVLHETLSPARAQQVGALAMVPAVLAAGEEVELACFDERSLSEALTAWGAHSAEAEPLWHWWKTYLAGSPVWPVALAALDRMLPAPDEV